MSDYQEKIAKLSSEIEADEQWIYSYADMMTLLLGFFIVMYSFSKFDEKKFDDVSSELAKVFKGEQRTKDPLSTEVSSEQKSIITMNRMMTIMNITSTNELHAAVEKAYENKNLSEQIKSLLDQKTMGGSEAKDPKRIEIVLPDQILFQAGGYRLKAASKPALEELANKLAVLGSDTEFEIVGHSDSSPLGKGHPLVDNFTLSSARAGAVAKFFIDRGLDKEAMSVKGMGDLKPILPEEGVSGRKLAEHRAANRRVEIIIKKKTP